MKSSEDFFFYSAILVVLSVILVLQFFWVLHAIPSPLFFSAIFLHILLSSDFNTPLSFALVLIPPPLSLEGCDLVFFLFDEFNVCVIIILPALLHTLDNHHEEHIDVDGKLSDEAELHSLDQS